MFWGWNRARVSELLGCFQKCGGVGGGRELELVVFCSLARLEGLMAPV